MSVGKTIAVTVFLTEDHLRKMVEDHQLGESEITDTVKLARLAQKLLDRGLGLPETPWHDRDDWGRGLE